MNEDRPICQRFINDGLVTVKCTFQWCIEYIDIARRSSARRRQTRVGMGKTSCLGANFVNISKKVGDTYKITIMND